MFRQQQGQPAAPQIPVPQVPQMPVTHAPAMQGGVNFQQLMNIMQQFQQGAGFPQPQPAQPQPQMPPTLGAMFSQFAGQNQQAGSASASTPQSYEDPERKRVRDSGHYDDQYDNQWNRGKRTKANDPKPVSFSRTLCFAYLKETIKF